MHFFLELKCYFIYFVFHPHKQFALLQLRIVYQIGIGLFAIFCKIYKYLPIDVVNQGSNTLHEGVRLNWDVVILTQKWDNVDTIEGVFL